MKASGGFPGGRDNGNGERPALRPSFGAAARSGALSLEDRLALIGDLLDRLAALHRVGQAHGSLGPETVLAGRGKDGEPRAVLELPDGTPPAPGYAAPERADGPAEPAADVWAAGALAFLLLAGRLPAAGEPALEVKGVPLRLGPWLDRMLSPSPRLRPSAADVARAVLSLREAGERSVTLLQLDDLEAIPRATTPSLDPERLDAACKAVLAESERLEDLPAFPFVAVEVVELSRRDDVGPNDLVRLINRDPVLIARVLRIANSAYANRGVEVTSARDAVTRLGLREVGAVAATAATRALFEGGRMDPRLAEAGRRLWLQALTSALSASWLAMECQADAQRAFLGGMLHDIGKTVALRALGRLVAGGRLPGLDPAVAAGHVLEATHVELGVRMARTWKLPEAAVDACARHHRPPAAPLPDRELHVVRLVSGLACLRVEPGWSFDRLPEIQESAAILGFDRFRVRATAAQVRTLAERAEALAKAAA